LNRTSVDVAKLVEDLETTLISTTSDVHLQIDMPSQPPMPIIQADVDRLRQVLTNLVITAAEMSRGKAITLHVKQLEEHVHLVISAPAASEVTRSNSDIHLALSRRLIELHGGRLHMAEHASGEIVFAFNIPITPQIASAPPPGGVSRSNGDKIYDERSGG
jgi:signal transduction histidine kinase